MAVKPPNNDRASQQLPGEESRSDLTFYFDDTLQETIGVEDRSVGQSIYIKELPPEYAFKTGLTKTVNIDIFRRELKTALNKKMGDTFGAMTDALKKHVGDKARIILEIKRFEPIDQAKILIALYDIQEDLANELLKLTDLKAAVEILSAIVLTDRDSGNGAPIIDGGGEISDHDIRGIYAVLREFNPAAPTKGSPLPIEAAQWNSKVATFFDSAVAEDNISSCQTTYGLDQFYNGDFMRVIAVGKQSLCEESRKISAGSSEPTAIADAQAGNNEGIEDSSEARSKKVAQWLADEYPGMEWHDALMLFQEQQEEWSKDIIEGLQNYCSDNCTMNVYGDLYDGITIKVYNISNESADALFIAVEDYCRKNNLRTTDVKILENGDGTSYFEMRGRWIRWKD